MYKHADRHNSLTQLAAAARVCRSLADKQGLRAARPIYASKINACFASDDPEIAALSLELSHWVRGGRDGVLPLSGVSALEFRLGAGAVAGPDERRQPPARLSRLRRGAARPGQTDAAPVRTPALAPRRRPRPPRQARRHRRPAASAAPASAASTPASSTGASGGKSKSTAPACLWCFSFQRAAVRPW